jgi:integrase
MSNGLPFLRKKSAKGKTYFYFDAGKGDDGQRILTKLPDIKDPRFGDCYARAKAARTNRTNKQGILTLDGLIRQYERSPEFRGLSASSQKSYTLYLGRAEQLLRSKKWGSPAARKIERKDILTLRDTLADTPGAANQVVRAMGALFAWAKNNERAKFNPAEKIKKFPAVPHEPWPTELLEEALADPQVGMAVALLYFTGQRINEGVKMSWRDIGDGFMRVYVQKTQRHIEVALLPELWEMLQRQPKDSVAILTNANGKPWTTSGLRYKLQTWAKERGIKVVPHGLRKNAVISLLEAGCTVSEVSGVTDQSIQMVEHYAKRVNKLGLGRAAVVKLDAHRAARNKG